MVMGNIGTVVLGSSALITSSANAEIIPTGKTAVNFSFMNDGVCTVIINGGSPIYLRDGQGIFLDIVKSFKVVNAGITFNWCGIEG